MWIRLALLSAAAEGLYLFWAYRSRFPVESGLLASWYRPVLFEETLEFLAAWALLVIVYALAIRATSRASGTILGLFVFASSAAFRLTLAIWGELETTSPPAFLEGLTPLSAALDKIPAPPELVRASAAIGLDLLALALAPALLRGAGLPTGLALVQGWNPLLVKEVAGTPRVEIVLAMAGLVAALRLLQQSRRSLAAVAYGLGLCGWPGLVATLPAMTRAFGARAVVALGFAGPLWWLALRGRASGNGLVALPTDGAGASLLPCLETIFGLFVSRNPGVPLVVAAAVWLVVATSTARAEASELPAALLPALGSFWFLAPQVMPWSFLPFAYLAGHSPNRGWLVFTATAPLTYLALGGGDWSFWLGFAQYFPAYASLTFVWLGGKKRG